MVSVPAGAEPSITPRTVSSVEMNSSASWKRRAGSFSRARSTTPSSSGGTAALSWEGGTGASLTCLSAMVTALSASKGTRAVSIS